MGVSKDGKLSTVLGQLIQDFHQEKEDSFPRKFNFNPETNSPIVGSGKGSDRQLRLLSRAMWLTFLPSSIGNIRYRIL